MPTVSIIVLDSVGVGALPDAGEFSDAGSHTLDHIIGATGLTLPNLARLGLGNIEGVRGVPAAATPLASHGRMRERSPGKDTTTGHWEFMGVVLDHPFRTFEAFPKEVMDAFDRATGRGHLGNVPASGTDIIRDLGAEHMKSGWPIVYTSADSVFQVACHTDVVPLEQLYEWCRAARAILSGNNSVARVIARPFDGAPGSFSRLGAARKDYSVDPPHATVLDALKAAGKQVVGLGKIPDIYSHRGFTGEIPTADNMDGVDRLLEAMAGRPDGLLFLNLVEFDSLYGHRRDVAGYAGALADFDGRLPEIERLVRPGDTLFIISDHGNDPTWHGTDHTREHGMLLAYRPDAPGQPLGTRSGFSDVGSTVAELLGVAWDGAGESFANRLNGG